MTDFRETPPMIPATQPAWVFVLFPATAMLLAWGLRGYIGGGPYGAMMPGGWVALAICLLLGYRMETAAIAAVCGAIGIGYGGNMTYGQTLGFLKDADTVWWGLLGCFIKGGMWGLVGGAILGVGLARDTYPRRTIIIALVLFVIAFFIGRTLINDPKYPPLYFSNLLDRPRDESWGGFLCAGLAFLAYLRFAGTREDWAIPRKFATWGFIGGALGFFGGALWMVLEFMGGFGPKWWSSWKSMEYSFGFILGGALGWCAYLNRDHLRIAGQQGVTPPASWAPLLLAKDVVFLALFRRVYMPENWRGEDADPPFLVGLLLSLTFGFVTLGAVWIVLGLFSIHAAWQIALTLAFYHTVLDYVRDLEDPTAFGYTLSYAAQTTVSVAAGLIFGVLVYLLQNRKNPIRNLLLISVWGCYLTGCVRSFGRKEIFFPTEGVSGWQLILDVHSSLFFVHGVFTVSAILTTLFIFSKYAKTESPQNT